MLTTAGTKQRQGYHQQKGVNAAGKPTIAESPGTAGTPKRLETPAALSKIAIAEILATAGTPRTSIAVRTSSTGAQKTT
jgi:hypothetical protein